jgi:hypothetical protein
MARTFAIAVDITEAGWRSTTTLLSHPEAYNPLSARRGRSSRGCEPPGAQPGSDGLLDGGQAAGPRQGSDQLRRVDWTRLSGHDRAVPAGWLRWPCGGGHGAPMVKSAPIGLESECPPQNGQEWRCPSSRGIPENRVQERRRRGLEPKVRIELTAYALPRCLAGARLLRWSRRRSF